MYELIRFLLMHSGSNDSESDFRISFYSGGLEIIMDGNRFFVVDKWLIDVIDEFNFAYLFFHKQIRVKKMINCLLSMFAIQACRILRKINGDHIACRFITFNAINGVYDFKIGSRLYFSTPSYVGDWVIDLIESNPDDFLYNIISKEIGIICNSDWL